MDVNLYMEKINAAAKAIEEACGKAEIAIILGSGLGAYGDALEERRELVYADIPGFPVSTVVGHAGRWLSGKLHGKNVYMMQGRFHSYEGYDMQTVIVTNAAGGVNINWTPGDLMILTDFINLTGKNPLTGPNLDEFGPRFPDMTQAYDEDLQALARSVGRKLDIELRSGVYCWLNGPTYETPAEIRMVRVLGADAVGMSTVPETIVARHCGMKVLGISCITNMAAGILKQPLNHEEVMETGLRAKDTFSALVDGIVERL